MSAAIDYARIMSDEELSEAIYLRIAKSDRAALEALAARMPLKSAAIARVALRIGLQAIERDPAAIFTAGKPSKRGR